jgi:cysteinyl-tRNA synthetase
MVMAEGGEKMSKSIGNTLSLLELVERLDPRALRFLVLQSHYRKPMIVTDDLLAAAERGVERLDGFAREFAAARRVAPDEASLLRFRELMDDDLDTPNAVAWAFESVRNARASRSAAQAAAVFDMFEGALGLPLHDEAATVPEAALAKGRERDAARAAKDWARADRLRAELQADGWTVEDGPDGTTLR